MKFNFGVSSLLGAFCLLFTIVNAAAIHNSKLGEIWIQRWDYSRDQLLTGLVKVAPRARGWNYNQVEILFASGETWQQYPIIAKYTGTGRDGWDEWAFGGRAPQATRFIVRYKADQRVYQDPPYPGFHSISVGEPSVTTRTNIPFPTFTARAQPKAVEPRAEPNFDAWLRTKYEISETNLKKNIGSSSNTNLPKGVVIASPSTKDPNYYYQWTRDASCVMEFIVGNYLENGRDLDYIMDWIEVQKTLQHLETPSGGFTTGGLGEPKYNVDNTAYTESWGRPQRDGPALRANTLMKFATKYISVDGDFVRGKLYDSAAQGQSQSIIKADLDYVASSWSQSSFDLWEEIQGQHFFTLIVSYRSMVEGAEFAKLMGDNAAADLYKKTADSMVDTIKGFWVAEKNYIVETHGIQGRSGLDCGVLLGALKAPYIFKPSGEEVLATTEAMINAFQGLYMINQNLGGPGFGIGRYPEDTYDGVVTSGQGNPWFICTATVAHVLYTAAADFKAAQSVNVTPAALNLFKRAAPSANAGTFGAGSQEFNDIVNGFKSLGDSFLEVVKRHSFTDGAMSEQFNRNTGFNQGARDLTWSYESVLEAIRARSKL